MKSFKTTFKYLPTREDLSVKLPQFTASVIGNILALTYGMVMGWASPSLPLLQSEENPELGGRPITTEEASLFGSLIFAGALLGSPVFGFVSQHFGRKAAGYLASVIFVPSWLIIAVTDSTGFYYVARFFMGFCCSGVLIFGPMYTSEISEDSIRGFLGTIRSLFSTLAILFMFAVGPYLTVRTMAYLCLTLPLVYIPMLFWLPESPMHLLNRGRTQEAMAAMLWLRGNNKALAEEDLGKISAVMNKRSEEASSLTLMKVIFNSRGARRALLICVVLGTCQQFTGISPIMSYLQDIFELSGSSLTPAAAAVVVAAMQFLGILLSSIFLDLAGRRVLLILSEVTVALCLGVLGVYFYLRQQAVDTSFLGVLPVVSLSVYAFFVSSGLVSVTYVVMGEMFDADARGMAAFVTTASIWLSAFVTTQFYMDLEKCIGTAGLYWCFAACSIACALFVYFQVPETKNRNLESILSELNGEQDSKTSVLKVSSDSNETQERY